MNSFSKLFEKYKNGHCDEQEIEELLAYFKTGEHEDLLKDDINKALQQHADENATLEYETDEVYNEIRRQLYSKEKSYIGRLLFVKWLAAAIVIICLSVGAYTILKKPVQTVAKIQKQDLLPGTDKAILITSNGQKIDIGHMHKGKITSQGNTSVTKAEDGRIVYEHANEDINHTAALIYNTLVTPRGGQHMLTLSDGTRVWLDAASSITFPVVFTGDVRRVKITGQVYFEVAHIDNKPFKVNANGQTVEVLGTHFNINAYTDEPVIKTTLFKGSVKVTKDGQSGLLKPGQQALVSFRKASRIVIKTADTDEAIAWHMGLFKFHDANTEEVMRQLARWYDVDVTYEGNIPDRRFSGEIYRNVNASKIAEILNYKHIHFRIEDRRIIVMP